MSSIILTILAFNFIIIIHELGHFAVAKMAGILVHEFSLFVGPKIFSIKRGETQYTLRLFPIMAYVKMEGEDEASESERSFAKKPILIRAAVIAAGPFANIIAAIILLTVVFSIAGYSTTKVDYVSVASPAYEAGIRSGDKIVKYDGKTILTPLNLIEYMYVTKGTSNEIEYIHNGQRIKSSFNPRKIPENRYILGFTAYDRYGENSNLVSAVSSGSPADKAGIIKNDRIIGINGVMVSSMTEIINAMQQNKLNPISLDIIRNGTVITINNIIPIQDTNLEQYEVGIDFVHESGNIIKSCAHSFVFSYATIRGVAYTVGWLVTGKVSLSQLSGPVGIATTINTAAEQGIDWGQKLLSLLNITAFISIAIGATNLVPFPALDGGKLFLLLIEAIRRKPIPVEKEAAITMVGFILLVALAIFATSNDILRFLHFK